MKPLRNVTTLDICQLPRIALTNGLAPENFGQFQIGAKDRTWVRSNSERPLLYHEPRGSWVP